MKTCRALWLVSVLALGAQVNAAEQDAQASDLWLIAKYDVDGDQVISMNEVSKKREKIFSFMDNDADGTVTFDEYRYSDAKKRELLLKARFDKLDGDQDGHLSTEEYSSYFGSFDRFDQNGDGRVTVKEMSEDKSVKEAKDEDKTHCLLWLCIKTEL